MPRSPLKRGRLETCDSGWTGQPAFPLRGMGQRGVLRALLYGLTLLVSLYCGAGYGAQARDAEPRYWFSIREDALGPALSAFVELTKAQLILPHDLAGETGVNPVIGRYSIREALDVLLQGTELSGGLTPSGVIVISLAKNTKPETEEVEKIMRENRGRTVLGVLAAMFAAGSVDAQPSQPQTTQTLEEIIVTARKRAESLQRVPVAVSVVDRELLLNNVAHDLTKVGELVPQVSLSQGGSGTGAVITVRGVSSGSNDAGLDQSVAIEIDGVPISRGQVISASLFDIDQVQVLQGPQALFFGKNSPAGVISLNSANPTDTFEGYVTAGYEFEADQRYIEGAVSGPLTDTLKARLAVRASEMDGWIRNVAVPTTDLVNPNFTAPGAVMGRTGPDDEIQAGRLTLLWEPREDFDANFKVMVNSQERNAGNSSSEPFCIGDTKEPVLLGTVPIPGGDCRKNGRKSHGAVAPEYAVNFPNGNGGVPYFDSDFTFASLALNKRWDRMTLTSTTGFYDQTVKQMSVSDWSPFATIWAASKETYDLWTQELRLSSEFDGAVNFMLGVYYEEFDRDYMNAADLFHTYNPANQSYATAIVDTETSGKNYAAFGQVNWRMAEDLELSVGARYSYDEKTSDLQNLGNSPAPAYATLLPEGVVVRSKFDDSNVSPEVTLSWFPSDDHTVYAAYKTGYKAGGVSSPFLLYNNATPRNLQFDSEEARGFEIGYKGTALDNSLRFDLVAYRYKYDDLQVASYNSETISFTINNAASAEIKGVQGSFEWLVLDDLTLRGNLGYNRAQYDRYSNAQCYQGQTPEQGCIGGQQDLSGEDLLRAPKLTYSIGADYYPNLVAGWNTTFSLQATRSSSFETATDNAPAGHQEAYWLVNASIRVSPESERFELALIGRNLTDEYYMLNSNGWSGSSNPNQQVGFFNRPRELVLQGTVRF